MFHAACVYEEKTRVLAGAKELGTQFWNFQHEERGEGINWKRNELEKDLPECLGKIEIRRYMPHLYLLFFSFRALFPNAFRTFYGET